MLSRMFRAASLTPIVFLAVDCFAEDGTAPSLCSKPWKEGERIVSQNGVQLAWLASIMILEMFSIPARSHNANR